MDAIELVRLEHARLQSRVEELAHQREKIDAEIRAIKTDLAEIEGALRVIKRFGESAGDAERPTKSLFGLVVEQPTQVTVRYAMFAVLKEMGSGRVGELLPVAERRFGMEINPKSAGNALWALKKEGYAARRGQVWYFIAPKAAGSINENAPLVPANGALSEPEGAA